MNTEQIDLFIKVHNELINRKRIKADKYEREDSCWGAFLDVKNGKKNMKDALIDAFKNVYDVEVSDAIYESCYNLCKGFKK